MSTDLRSSPLPPEGYPAYLRMFAVGIEPELAASATGSRDAT